MDQDQTVRRTSDQTVAMTGDPTVRMAAEPTVATGSEPTVAIGGDPTVRMAAEPTVAMGEPTVAIGGEPTVAIGGEPTVRMAGEPTVAIGGEPTMRVSGASTVRVPPQVPDVVPGRTPPSRPPAPADPTPAPAATRGTRYVTRPVDDTRVEDRSPVAEVRFGPGVPAPGSAPGWQSARPVRPRRSPWRLISSVLSGLLTVALLVAVGLYLWERLSPLEITSVTVAVPNPPGDQCDVTVDVVATVHTNGNAGTISYQWLRSGKEPTAMLTERVARGQRTVTLTLKWVFSGVGTTTETATVNITEPAPVQGQTTVTYRCERG